MSQANPATYNARGLDTPIAGTATPPATFPRKRPARRARSLGRSGRPADSRPFPDPSADRQVRERPEDYLPDVSSDEEGDADPKLSRAADKHTKALRKAMRDVGTARNLLAVLIASMADIGDSRAMQAETVLTIVEKKLHKAHTRIDRQEMHHRQFFLAHVER